MQLSSHNYYFCLFLRFKCNLKYYNCAPGLGPAQSEQNVIPEYTATDEAAEERSWRSVILSGIERRIDLKVSLMLTKCFNDVK